MSSGFAARSNPNTANSTSSNKLSHQLATYLG
jgi:hypothetical protein